MKNEKTFVDIQPCECNVECGQYILYIHGDITHIKEAPPELIDVASLSVFDLISFLYLISSLNSKTILYLLLLWPDLISIKSLENIFPQ